MNKEQLYKEEQELLNKLVEAENNNDKFTAHSARRTIRRINKEMEQLDGESN